MDDIGLVHCGLKKKVGVRFVKDEEEGWTHVVSRRRKKSTRSEGCESEGELDVDGGRQIVPGAGKTWHLH